MTHLATHSFNTQYMTNSTLVCPVKIDQKEYFWPKRGVLIKSTSSVIFFLDHFSPSFLGQKYYFFITYSILTGQTKVEFVIYWVLNRHGILKLYEKKSLIQKSKKLKNLSNYHNAPSCSKNKLNGQACYLENFKLKKLKIKVI